MPGSIDILDAAYRVIAPAGRWPELRAQLMFQWPGISGREWDQAGSDRRALARLVERSYGINYAMVEHYLYHFERTLPSETTH